MKAIPWGQTRELQGGSVLLVLLMAGPPQVFSSYTVGAKKLHAGVDALFQKTVYAGHELGQKSDLVGIENETISRISGIGFQPRFQLGSLDPSGKAGYKPPMMKRRKKQTRLRSVIALFLKAAAALVAASILLTLLLRWVPPPTSAFMIRQHLAGVVADYRWVPLERISPYAALAVIASEDQNFFIHRGLDFKAIRKAVEDKLSRSRLRGASTISQQVAKNLFLWPGRSYLRKGVEAYFTLIMELLWPKARILEVYLNIAEMGRGVFGVEAAGRRFFGKPAASLSRREAAALAAVLPDPARRSADRPSGYVSLRTRQILRQMELIGGTGFLRAQGLDLKLPAGS
jgi:monofunctional biosynthetic peptidoglycan transglycosylase